METGSWLLTLLLLEFHTIFLHCNIWNTANLIIHKHPILCNYFIRGEIGMKLLYIQPTPTLKIDYLVYGLFITLDT